MNNFILLILAAASILAVGSILGYYTRQTIAKKQSGTIEAKLNQLITQAKFKAKEILTKAEERANAVREEAKIQEKERQALLSRLENRIEKRERDVEQRAETLGNEYSGLQSKIQKVKRIKKELEDLKESQLKSLEKAAALSKEEAKTELLALAEKEYAETLLARIKKLELGASEELNKKAQEIIALAVQRYAGSVASEITSTTVSLPSDELKGRIIGKEGRNIKALERLTGVEVLVDDTPGAIVLSAFDPIRRQIAKIALDKLLLDGRIQPARIEETVEFAKEEIGRKIQEAGEAAVYDVGLAGLDPKLIKLLGRLRFRTSYGQNVLLHSLEVAHLAAAIASELGADVILVKKAGLLHDIGKVVDHEIQGSHVEIGRNILKKFNIEDKVIQAMQAHHEEYPYESLESIIVQAADAISGARPGARKDSLEAYLKRLEELENVANSFAGVEKAYAIQAGREVRVFVRPEQVDDLGAYKLAKEIAQRVEEELRFPGEIKINLIRETRVVEYAR